MKGVVRQRTAAQLCYQLGPEYARWRWDEAGLRRVVPHEVVQLLGDWLLQRAKGTPIRVWCLFANLGTEASALSRRGIQVLCNQPDSLLGRENLSEHAPEVVIGQLDPMLESHWPRADVVLLNPPWGSAYDRGQREHFNLAELQLENGEQFAHLFERLRARFSLLVVVAPTRGQPFDKQFRPDSAIEFTKLKLLFYNKECCSQQG